MIHRLFKKNKPRFPETFQVAEAEYADKKYQVRELSYPERMFFITEVAGGDNALLSCAWLVSKACLDFIDIPPEKIVNECGPGAIDAIANKILEVSKMQPGDIENTEKES